MAVTRVVLVPGKAERNKKARFHVTAYSADWSGGEIAVAAPAAGSLYVERMLVFVGAATTLVLGDGSTDWTFVGTASGNVYPLEFREPVKLAATTAITGTGGGAGACVTDIEGFIA